MYADVVIDSPSSPKIPYYTYRVPDYISNDIKLGQVVLAHFGKKEVKGWVINISRKTTISQLKDIIKILSPIPVLLPNYIKLLKWVSWYYHAPMVDCLKLMLPEFSKKQLNNLTIEQLDNVKKGSQELIITPSLHHLAETASRITDTKGIVVYHHELKAKEKYEAWKRIYFGEVKKIIGLRSAIFAPCQNLKRIKIVNEEDQAYFEERSPYYNLLTVAKKLCQIAKAELVLESKTPRIETVYEFLNRKNTRRGEIKLSLKTQKPKSLETQIVDIADEIRAGNRTPISDALRYSLIENFRKKKSSLLFLNRLKESGQLFCLECKFSGYQPKPPRRCPNCQGTYFKFYSLNLNKIAQIITNILANAKIEFITSKNQSLAYNQGLATKDQSQAIVTLATSAIFYSPPTNNYALIGIISADSILNFPDFRSSERAFSTISQLIDLADKDGQVIIQTYNPQHPAIKFAAAKDYQRFYRQELKERKALGYPPFSIFAKLSICQKRETLAEKKAQKIYNLLLFQAESNKKVEVFPPSPSILLQKACYNIILRSKARVWLDPLLELVPSEWKVEIEPKELS